MDFVLLGANPPAVSSRSVLPPLVQLCAGILARSSAFHFARSPSTRRPFTSFLLLQNGNTLWFASFSSLDFFHLAHFLPFLSCAGPCYCTMNLHNLVHWRQNVERAGPLWATSCFLFEAENGKIDDEIQGTNQVVMAVRCLLFFSSNT